MPSSSGTATPASAPAGKRVLGRGLSDLLGLGGVGGSNDDAAAGGGDAALPGVPNAGPPREVAIGDLHRNPRQPRTRFDEAALTELADSVRANGVLQPLLVRPRAPGVGGYEIVAGERRYRAALRAGLTHLPVVVRELSDSDTLALALIENLIREDIGPMETARAFHRLMDEYGWTQEEMGLRVGKSRSAVANSLRLLSLPSPIQKSLEEGEISEGHARALIGDERLRQSPGFGERQLAAWRQAVARKLSVRDVERQMRDERAASAASRAESVLAVAAGTNGADFSGREVTFSATTERQAIEDRLRWALGTRVRLAGSLSRGKIEIEYFSGDELDGLLARLESAPSAPAA